MVLALIPSLPGCGGEEEVVVEPTVEEKIKEKGVEIKALMCERKSLQAEMEVDSERIAEIESELAKLHKKASDLLQKNKLSSKQLRTYTKKYLNPSVSTLDC